MKILIDLKSVATGVASALALGLLVGFAPQTTSVATQAPAAKTINACMGLPSPNDLVTINSGTGTYVVPQGYVLVISAIRGSIWSITVNGQSFIQSNQSWRNTDTLPIGIPLNEGESLSVSGCSLHCYLERLDATCGVAGPRARDLVRLGGQSGETYLVPQGRTLVVKSLSSFYWSEVRVNGTPALGVGLDINNFGTVDYGTGYPVSGGSTVELWHIDPNRTMFITGYLADARLAAH